MTPLIVVLLIVAFVCVLVLVASVATGDYSWVDRSWSIVPAIYVWVFAGFAGLSDTRLNVMAILVTAWAARLTFNFARKGGYSGVEDYRWAILRSRMTRRQFQIFNVFFITLYQNLILVLIALPALTAYNYRGRAFGALDAVVTVLFVLLLAGETVADQQQWNFQQAKKAGGATFRPRFVSSGLWKYSRHPNFFFEQAQWWTLFLFGAIAAGSLLQWTVIGALLLTMLFVGSMRFTEAITLSKYPEYAEYQATTSPMIPWVPRRARQAESTAA